MLNLYFRFYFLSSRGVTVVCLNCDFLTDVSGLDSMATHLSESHTHTCQVIIEKSEYLQYFFLLNLNTYTDIYMWISLCIAVLFSVLIIISVYLKANTSVFPHLKIFLIKSFVGFFFQFL